MALDFYKIHDRRYQNKLFQLDEKELDDIRQVLEKFQKLTGVYLDPYGTTRIYFDQVRLLNTMLETYLNDIKDYKENKRISIILDKLKIIEGDILALGD
jgi:hypothetical protein